MGFKDLQVLVLLVWLWLGHVTFAQPEVLPADDSERRAPANWSVTSTEPVVRILLSKNRNFSLDLMLTDRSKDACAAVVQHVQSNTTVWIANFDSGNSNSSNAVQRCWLNFTREAGLVLTGDGQPIWKHPDNGIWRLRLDDTGILHFDDRVTSLDRPVGDTLLRSQTYKREAQPMKAANSSHIYSAGGVFSMRIDGSNLTLEQHFHVNGEEESLAYESFQPNKTQNIKSIGFWNGRLVAFYDNNENASLSMQNHTWDYARLEPTGNLAVKMYNGSIERLVRDDGGCRLPGACGAFGICDPGSAGSECTCPKGFVRATGRQDCNRLPFSVCGNETEVVNITGQLPHWTTSLKGAQNLSREQCESRCRSDCNCTIALHVDVGLNELGGAPAEVGSCFLNLDSMQTIRVGGQDQDTHMLFLRISTVALRPTPGPGPGPTGGGSSSRRTAAEAFAGGAGAVVLLLLALSAWWLVLNRRKIFDEADRGVYDAAAGKSALPTRYSYEQLRVSTGGSTHVFGESFVFFGTLPNSSDTKIAVKVLEDRGHKDKEFVAAVATMGRLTHPNLVPLLGYCKEGRHKMLVYELVNEGKSLSWLLFDVPPMDASTRRLIALGTAQGLQYLDHMGVMHGGMKPENILIDAHRQPKLVDYALLELGSTQPFLSRGYMAPELPRLTATADVYSLGVVILELVSGRRALVPEALPEERRYLPVWGFALLRHNNNDLDCALELADPRLGDAHALPETDQQVLKGMVFVALCCVQADPELRPSMDEVVRMLEGGRTINAPPTSPALDDYAEKLCSATPQLEGFIHSPSLSQNHDMRPR